MRRDRPVGHAQHLRTAAERREKFGIGTGHPALGPERHDFVEQGGPALAVEMGRDLVEQQQRRPAARDPNSY